jgi:hypothetical protein
MAPPDRQPDPGHPAAAGLDGEFGHEGEIAAWVEWLLHPEQHEYDRIYVMGGERYEVTYRDRSWEEDYGNAPESVIQGCFAEQFFDPALALSGQQFGDGSDLSKAYEALDDAFWKNNDWNGKLKGGFEDLRQHWQSESAGHAGEFLGAIEDFMADFVEVAKQLAAISIAYAGIVVAARRNLNEAMGRLVDAFHTKFYARENPWHKVLIAALSAASAAALTYVTGGTAAAAWGAGLATVIDKALDATDGDADIGGGTWREVVDSYFVAQMKILQQARGEIEKLGNDAAKLIGRLQDMPKLPG